MNGLILKGVGGFYSVLGDDARTYTCHARGRFRKDGVTPLPGDRVQFAYEADAAEGYLEEILPRRNTLVRPAAANVDKLFIVVSASLPKPDLLLVDKLIVYCERNAIAPLIIINKLDEGDEAAVALIAEEYAPTGYPLLCVSARTHEGMDGVVGEIAGYTCCLAGQSAVGKSSVLNAIMPGLALEVGDLSRKTERGRHTTRHAELFLSHGGRVLDTPGFSLFETEAIEPEALSSLYPEMRAKAAECRFPGCMHISEPDCAVKPLIACGGLSAGRYERYKIIAQELKEMQKYRYD